MAGDPFSSHPYPSMKEVKPVHHYCQPCAKDMRMSDKTAHERGKKHVEKVKEQNSAFNIPSTGYGFGVAAPSSSDRACYNCGLAGHQSRECTEPRKDTRECHHCHEVGHAKADCPTLPRSKCFNCGEEGHRKTECIKERQMLCRNCNNTGHFAKECPEPPNPSNFKCNNCDNMGHKARDCPEPKDWSKVKCNTCGEMGHTSVRCKSEAISTDISGWDNGNSAFVISQPLATTHDDCQDPRSWDDTVVANEMPSTDSWDDTEATKLADAADDWSSVVPADATFAPDITVGGKAAANIVDTTW